MIVNDLYLSNIHGLARMQNQDRIDIMLKVLERPLDVGLRNRFMHDCIGLLDKGKAWDAKADLNRWSFEKIAEEQSTLERFRNQFDKKLFDLLHAKFEKIVKDTYTSFEQFQEASQSIAGDKDFLDWYYQNLPYATLGLELNGNWDDNVKKRLRWMMDRCPPSQTIDEQTQEALIGYGKKFVFDWLCVTAQPA